MGDSIMRHLVALSATLICLMAYYSGYVSSKQGWWWTVFALLVVYGFVFKLVNKD